MPLLYSPRSLAADRTTGSAGNSEECLNLNIFTPPAAATTAATTTPAANADATATATAALNAATNATAAANARAEEPCAADGGGEGCPRPARAVMVWVHGGCSSFGSNQAPVYDGAPLAATQDVVVVSINYRLGGLGFLTLTSPSPSPSPLPSPSLHSHLTLTLTPSRRPGLPRA